MVILAFFPDFDMKKDIEQLIAEERADILTKYDKVGKPAVTSEDIALISHD